MSELNLQPHSPPQRWREWGGETAFSNHLIMWMHLASILILSSHLTPLLPNPHLDHLISIQKTLLPLRIFQGF